jgi:uncharacterized protein (TIGR02271 family)
MARTQQLETWIGHDAEDREGRKIGSIEEIYLDNTTGTPEWLAIKTGMFGHKLSFAPVQGTTAVEDRLRVPVDKDTVKDAPKVDPDGQLEPDDEEALYRHYGRAFTPPAERGVAPAGSGRDRDGNERTEAMTRSEEQLDVDKRSKPSGTARLRKYVVTEHVTTTVPVQREEVRIEREPITDARQGSGRSGGDLGEEEREIVLHEEEVVTQKKVVPKEKVRLSTDTVSEERQVSEDVRKERIEMDRNDGRTPGR